MKMKSEFDNELTGVGYEGLKSKVGSRGYKAVNTIAILGIIFGLLGVIGFFVWQMLALSLLGFLLAGWALYKHFDMPLEVGGYYLAVIGISVSAITGLSGGGYSFWSYYYSVPRGYIEVDFADMALTKDRKVPEYIAELGRENKKVFIKGYMYQGRQRSGLTNFIMVRTLAHCKFCSPEQNPADMIQVFLVPDLKVNYRTTPIRIGGTLYVNENFQYGEMPYLMEVDVFR